MITTLTHNHGRYNDGNRGALTSNSTMTIPTTPSGTTKKVSDHAQTQKVLRFHKTISEERLLPKERRQMTSRDVIKCWYTETELMLILGDGKLEYDMIMKIIEHENNNNNEDDDEGEQEGKDSKSNKKKDKKKTKKDAPTVRGLEHFHTDEIRKKQQDDAIRCVLTLQQMKQDKKKIKNKDKNDIENKDAADKISKKEQKHAKDQLELFYKQVCEASTYRALQYGQLDQLSIIKYANQVTTYDDVMEQHRQEHIVKEEKRIKKEEQKKRREQLVKSLSWKNTVRKSWPSFRKSKSLKNVTAAATTTNSSTTSSTSSNDDSDNEEQDEHKEQQQEQEVPKQRSSLPN